MLDLAVTPVPDAAIGAPTAIITVCGRPVGRYVAPLPIPVGDTVYFPTGFGSLALATLVPAPGVPRGQRGLPALDFADSTPLHYAAAFAARLRVPGFVLDDQEDSHD